MDTRLNRGGMVRGQGGNAEANENRVYKASLHQHRLRKNDGGIGRVSSWKGRLP